MSEDTVKLVGGGGGGPPGRVTHGTSYTEPSCRGGHSPPTSSSHTSHSFTYSAPTSSSDYRAGLGGGCCHLEDTAALRMIVVWMATVAVVVFVALVVEIINQEHLVQVGDVVTDHPNCSSLASSILHRGGNAVDAAVAAALCLTITVPHSAGLGGGGVMLIHDLRKNSSVVVDFQEVSPASLNIRQYTDNPNTIRLGPKSAGVPGLVAGLYHAHIQYGSGLVRRDCCGWGDLVRGSLQLLTSGFPVSGDWAHTKQRALQQPGLGGDQQFRDFLKSDGYSLPSSPQSQELHTLLTDIFEHPVEKFYNGGVGMRLVKDLAGHLSREDLRKYTVVERNPVQARVGSYSVLTSPAPTSGPELLAILGAVEGLVQEGEKTFDSAEYLEKLRDVMETVHGEARLLGDPLSSQEHQHNGFVSVDDRTRELLSQESLARWRENRGNQGPEQAIGGDSWQSGSHLAVMDWKDLYVSCVLSLGGQFGSRTFSQGFLVNNALASFDLSPVLSQVQGVEEVSSNLLREAHRPLTRIAPVVAVHQEMCGLRILTGSALAEVAAQVLAPVLLSPAGDLNRALKEPKLVIVNGSVRAEDGLGPNVLQQLDSKDALLSLGRTFSPSTALEKVKNSVTGFTDHRGGQQEDGRWATLTPKYVQT